MNLFTGSQRYYLFAGPTDMRKSFDGLSGLVRDVMKKNLMTGDVFIFINRSRDSLKLLVWDRSGFVIWYKRLEEGTFEIPAGEENEKGLPLRWEELVMILEGIRLESVHRRKRYAAGALVV